MFAWLFLCKQALELARESARQEEERRKGELKRAEDEAKRLREEEEVREAKRKAETLATQRMKEEEERREAERKRQEEEKRKEEVNVVLHSKFFKVCFHVLCIEKRYM